MLLEKDDVETLSIENVNILIDEDLKLKLIFADGNTYEISTGVCDALLNQLKIPMKYFYRMASKNIKLAEDQFNFWVKDLKDMAAVIEDGTITQVYDSRRAFVPVRTVDQAICSQFGIDRNRVISNYDGEYYIGVYPIPDFQVALQDGSTATTAIRIIYSDCFSITPRLDSVLTVDGSFDNFYYPINGRKFRVANAEHTQIINQIIEFASIVNFQLKNDFIPALNTSMETMNEAAPIFFVKRMCSDLRLSKKIGAELLEGIDVTVMHCHHDLVRKISNNLLPEVRSESIDVLLAREIEIALGRSLVRGSFK